MENLFVAFAMPRSSPIKFRTGRVRREPPPANVLRKPAATPVKAARRSGKYCEKSKCELSLLDVK